MPRSKVRAWNFRVRRVLVVALVAPFFTAITVVSPQTAFAAPVSAPGGSCTQDVGNITGITVTRVANDCVITFTSRTATTWRAPAGISNVRYLVVGGGASGDRGTCGVYWGRGGGGGQVRDSTLSVVAGTNYSVVVGKGGNGATDSCPNVGGNSGVASQFANITASPGLGGQINTAKGGVSGSGLIGGVGSASTLGAGGGGGAGVAGSGKNGGAGVNSDITGTTIMYGSGGAGRDNNGTGTASAGGATGNGAAAANRGGGGADYSTGWYAGADGVVIIRYTDYVPMVFPQVAYNPTTLSIGAGVGGRSDTFTATNGFGTRTFSLSPGRSGISIDTSTANGVALVVSPLVASGTYLETLTVTDAAGFAVNHVVTVTVASSVRFDTLTATSLVTTYGRPTSLQLNTTGGVGTKVFTMTAQSNPAITLDTLTAGSGFATLNIASSSKAGTYTVSFSVTDSTRIRSTLTVVVTVNPLPNITYPTGTVPSLRTNNLVIHYDIRNALSYSGSGTTVTSLVGNSNATITSTAAYSTLFDGHLNVTGGNYIGTNTCLAGIATGAYSNFLWIKPRANGIVLTENNGGWHTSTIEVNGGTLKFRVYNGAILSYTMPALNRWYYVGLVYDGTRQFAYVNGVQVGSSAMTRSTSTVNCLGIGRSDGTNLGIATSGEFLFGALHSYGAALSATDVLNNFDATQKSYLISTPKSGSFSIETTQGLNTTYSTFTATDGTRIKTFGITPTVTGITIETGTANSAVLRIGPTAAATSTTVAATYLETLTATDEVGAVTKYDLTIKINPPIIIAASIPLTLTTTFGRIAYDTFTATQGTGTKIFTGISSSNQSAFVVTNPSANVGLLTVAANLPVGTYLETITATDAVGATTNYFLTVIVNPVPTIAGATGNTLTTTLARTASLRINVLGGSGTRVISWTSPNAGITLETSTLSVQNFITLNVSAAVPVRTYSFAIAAVDSTSARVSDTFTVVVNRWPVIGTGGVVTDGLRVNLDASTYSGSGNWLDTSGFGRHAIGASASTAPAGIAPTFIREFDGAFSHSGALNQFATTPNLSTGDVFSVETWVRFDSLPPIVNPAGAFYPCVVTDDFLLSVVNYSICFTGSNEIKGGYWRTNKWVQTPGFTPIVGTWYHFVYTVSKSESLYTSRLFQNGNLVGSTTDAMVPGNSGGNTYIGKRWGAFAEYVNGLIPIVRVYNQALSSAQVVQNYNASGSRFVSTNSGRETLTVTQGVAGSLSAVTASQGTGTKTLTLSNTNPGITIDTSTANTFSLALANTLTATSATVARTLTETVTATDTAGATTSRVYSVVVNPPIRIESTTSTITTTSGILAFDTLTATFGTGNKTFALTGTPSTAGFTLTQASNRAVLRVDTTANPGTYNLVITATDAVGATTSLAKTVIVNARPTITGNPSVAGTTGYAFTSQSYSAANGTGTLTYSITTVPATVGRSTTGITLSATTGSPTINVSSLVLADTYTVTLRVTDSLTAFTTFIVTLRVNPLVTISGNLSLTKVYGEELAQVYTTGGTGTAPFNIFASTICTSEKSNYTDAGVTYTVERFNGIGTCTWAVPTGVTSASVLVVGGGGAGGSVDLGSSGGGGGGRVLDANLSLTSVTTLQVIVGAGGIPTPTTSVTSIQSSGDGGTSSVTPNGGSTTSALGGGGGANSRLYLSTQGVGSTAGWTGGGGSVHASTASNGSTGTGGAGFKGGNAHPDGSVANPQAAGGGGGAGGAGGSASTVSANGAAGNGGIGFSSSITGLTTSYGGGGGGGKRTSSGTAGTATGGGGAGGQSTAGSAGSRGTGGGGGGAGEGSPARQLGGAGGSGTVIVRYVTPIVDTQTTRLTMDTLATTPTGFIRLNAPRLLPVQTYTQTITVRDSAATPATTSATITLVVSKATPTLTLALPGSVTTAKYGNPVTISAVATTPGTVAFVNGSSNITACTAVATIAGLATCSFTPTVVGATTLRATLTPTDTANFNSSAQVNLAITVAKADTLTVTVTSLTRQFTGSTALVTAAFTTSGLVAIDSLTAISMLYSGNANSAIAYSNTTAPTNAGTYSITPNFPANASAYTFVAGSLGTTSSLSNYESVTVIAGTLTINRAPQVMSFTYPNSNTATYSPTGTITASATTFLDSAARLFSSSTLAKCTIDSATAVISIVEAGSCQVAMAVAQTFNYLADTATATVTINKAARTFSLTPAVATLKFAESTTVTATLSDGALDGDISYILGSPAGCDFDPLSGVLLATSGSVQCPLRATISEGLNYLAETTTAISLTIARANAPLITIDTVTAMSHTPGLRALITPTFSVTGLKNLDTASSLTFTYSFISNPFETFTYSDTETPIDAATYRITPSALTLSAGLLSNYETPTYSSSAIDFIINRINQESVTIENTNGEVEVPFVMMASGGNTSGALTFTKISGDGCSVSGNQLTTTQAGACVLTVTMAGNRNFLAVTSEAVTVRVRNFIVFVVEVPSNPVTGITIAPSVPVVKGPDICTTGCVPKIITTDVFEGAEAALVLITGLSFNGVTKVYFNIYTEAPNFLIVSDTQISVRVPADLPLGDATIEVISPGGLSNRYWDFVITP